MLPLGGRGSSCCVILSVDVAQVGDKRCTRSSSSWTGQTALIRCWCCSGREYGGPFRSIGAHVRILDVWVLSPVGIDSGQHLVSTLTGRRFRNRYCSWHGWRFAHGDRIQDTSHWPRRQARCPRKPHVSLPRNAACKALAGDQGAARAMDRDWCRLGDDACFNLAFFGESAVMGRFCHACHVRLTRFKTLIWVGVMLIFVAWQV